MASGDGSHGQDGDEIGNLPRIRHKGRQSEHDHARDTHEREGEAELELLDDLGHLDEEVGEFGFLGRRAPGHVDFEHVRQEGRRHVEGETAEEDGEHEDPFEVLED